MEDQFAQEDEISAFRNHHSKGLFVDAIIKECDQRIGWKRAGVASEANENNTDNKYSGIGRGFVMFQEKDKSAIDFSGRILYFFSENRNNIDNETKATGYEYKKFHMDFDDNGGTILNNNHPNEYIHNTEKGDTKT